MRAQLSESSRPMRGRARRRFRGAGVVLTASALLVTAAACSSSKGSGAGSSSASTTPSQAAGASAGSSSGTASVAASAAPSVSTISAGKLAVAVQSDQFPFDFVQNGKEVGFSIDLMNEIAKRLNLKPSYTTTSLQGLLAGVPSKQYDVAAVGLSITAARQKQMSFSEPYYYGYYGVLAKKSSDIAANSDFAGKTVALVSGSAQDTYAQQHYPKAQIKRFDSQPPAIAALEGGQVDAFFVGGPDTMKYLQQYSDLKLVATIQTATPNGFPMPLDDKTLVDGVNTELDAMFADGTYTTIYKKWFTQPLPPKLVSEHPVLGGGAASSAPASSSS